MDDETASQYVQIQYVHFKKDWNVEVKITLI